MGENSLGTGVARNNLDGHVCLFVCVVNTNQKQTDFSVEMLLRDEESLFRFSADGTQKKTGKKKEKMPSTLHSRNSHDICFTTSKTKYMLH